MTYTQTKWNLTPLYAGYESAELQNAFDMVEEQTASFEGVRGKLTPDISSEQFIKIMRASEETSRIAHKQMLTALLLPARLLSHVANS